ncbi:uncharacterized protein LOC141589989 [Silene latifolia]|uniref:uncharacterized protein LOC141589989 n=1 Tax=Silene latifolia TaxID=37657 RepID=UPI003D77E286
MFPGLFIRLNMILPGPGRLYVRLGISSLLVSLLLDYGCLALLDTQLEVVTRYQWIRQKQSTVTWDRVIWNSWCISKHSFISWLIAREALQLKDKLFLLGIIADDTCFLCGSAAENHTHLFSQCCYTRQLFKLLSLKLNVCLPVTNLLVWMQTKPWAKIKKRVTIVWIQALYYAIWNQRNKARLEGVVQRP